MSITLWIIAFFVGILIGGLTSVTGKHIAVLGMQGAGKTRFYRFLQGKEYIEGDSSETIQEKYEGFDYIKSDGTTVHIKEGYDYGGSEEIALQTNEKLISENETIFFIFDFYKYITQETYKDKTNGRLNFIMKKIGDKQLYVIGTHTDLIKDSELFDRSKKAFEGYILAMGYDGKLEKSFALINMTNQMELKKVVDKIF